MKKVMYSIMAMLLVFVTVSTRAQHAYFPAEGTILYEKTVHIKNLLKRHISTIKDDNFNKKYYQELMDRASESVVLKKKVSFRGDEMSMESVAETHEPIVNNLLRSGLLDYQQTLYQNLSKSISRSAFEVYGSPVMLEDSLLQVKWKITNEYRNIAGYDCRRANGVTLDSVYVVAFYTDQIPLSAGPGAIHGLPGMILGLAVPEQHYNIYATEVKFGQPELKSSVGRKRDKPMTREEAQKNLKDRMGRWMSEQQFNLVVASMFL